MITYWFLPGIILLGIVTTYTDLKEGKIKNKHLILALVYSLLTYALLMYLNWGSIRPAYFIELSITCLMALITGFLLWYVGLWTAGDAKLLVAYTAIVPLSVYTYGHIAYFNYTNLLINTFVPTLVYFFFIILIKTSFRQKMFFIKKAFNTKGILSVVVFVFAFGWIITLLFSLFKIPADYFITMFILFLIMTLLEKITSVSTFKIAMIIGILRLIFDRSIFSYQFLVWFLSFIFSFVILRFFILNIGFYIFTKEVDIKLLKPGMVPAETVYEKGGGYNKQELMLYSLFGYFEEKTKKRKYLIEPTSEGLKEKEVAELKKLENKFGFEHIRIQQTIPFAPYMFIGALITVILQGNMFIVMRLALPF